MKLSLVFPVAFTALSLFSCQQSIPGVPASTATALSSAAVSPQRPDLIDLGNTQTEEHFSAEESLALQPLIAQAEAKIAEEDARIANVGGDFLVQSADQGKDIDIELFLYHPKYGKKAKSWGIDNANEFLQAGRSPWRRWLLRLKLEGLFAPKDFSRQLLFWVEQADLLRLHDVNPDQAWLLVASGVTSVPDLARRSAFELGAMVVSMQITALTYGIDAPSLSELKDWAEEAQALEPVIY
jgi:hypothetical protein